MGSAPRPLPATANDAPPGASASYWVPTQSRYLPTTIVRPGPEGRLPERGGHCPTAAPAVRGGRRQAAGRATPEATDVRGTGGGGRTRAWGDRSRAGRSAGRTTSRRSGRSMHGSTDDEPFVFGVPKLLWTDAAKVKGGVPWHAGVVKGAERYMTSWHKGEEEASRKRATKRDTKTKSGIETAKTKGAGGRGATEEERDGAGRKRKRRGGSRRATRSGLTNVLPPPPRSDDV